MKSNPVRRNTELHRFEMDTPAGLAIADYRLAGNVMTMFHTEVPGPLRGRGYGYHLVRGALLQGLPRQWSSVHRKPMRES